MATLAQIAAVADVRAALIALKTELDALDSVGGVRVTIVFNRSNQPSSGGTQVEGAEFATITLKATAEEAL